MLDSYLHLRFGPGWSEKKQSADSVGRKMDMLNSDLLLKNEVETKPKGKKRKLDEDENESGFHFIAFMPIEGQLWKLDGLERQPMCLGTKSFSIPCFPRILILSTIGAFENEWLGQAKPDIEARMAQYEEGQIEFAILSLIRDPLMELIPRLAENVKGIAALSARLDTVQPDWQSFETSPAIGEATGVLTTADPSYGLTQEDIDKASIPETVAKLCISEIVQDIVNERQHLVTAQAGLRMSIRDEQQSNQSDDERAAARSCDYGACMPNFVRKVRVKRKSLDSDEKA